MCIRDRHSVTVIWLNAQWEESDDWVSFDNACESGFLNNRWLFNATARPVSTLSLCPRSSQRLGVQSNVVKERTETSVVQPWKLIGYLLCECTSKLNELIFVEDVHYPKSVNRNGYADARRKT